VVDPVARLCESSVCDTATRPQHFETYIHLRAAGPELRLELTVWLNGASEGPRAIAILREYHRAEAELDGRGVVLTDGKAGTVEGVTLDEVHGLRLSVAGHPASGRFR
jgi:hypothetical protein